MMTSDAILAECNRRCIGLRLEAGHIRYTAAGGMMTRMLLEAIKANKAEIISSLSVPDIPDISGAPPPTGDTFPSVDKSSGSPQVSLAAGICGKIIDKRFSNIPYIPYIPLEKLIPDIQAPTHAAPPTPDVGVCVVTPRLYGPLCATAGDIGDIDVSRCSGMGSVDTSLGDIPYNLGDTAQQVDVFRRLQGPHRPPTATPCLYDPSVPDSIDMPASSWRWAVANWPHDRWVAWRRRTAQLEPVNATADQIRAAEHCAYVELAGPRTGSPSSERAAIAPPEREAIQSEHRTVAEEFAHRGGHRAVLKGLRMEHLPTRREFTCLGSEWGKDGSLLLYATPGRWEPGHEPEPRSPGLYHAADYDMTRFNPPAKLAASQCALRAPWPAECPSPDEPEDDGPDVPDALPPASWSDIDGFTPADIDAMIKPFCVVMWWRRMGDGAIHDAAMDCFSALVAHLDEERQDVFFGWIESALAKAKTDPDGWLEAAIAKAKTNPE